MNMEKLKHIYGLDFGTSNTHLSFCTANDLSPIVEDIKIHSESSIPSAVLYDEKTFSVLTFGRRAVEEWYGMDRKERKKYKLATDFKQRMAFNKRSQSEAELFLSELFRYLDSQKLIAKIPFGDTTVLTAGIPSKTVGGHSDIFSGILEKCTGTRPVIIEEPLGALFFHIMRKDINKQQARSGVLVADFGGGTLDFAYLRNFKIHAKWGSPFIGGNLFDDLFYSVFLGQNPGIHREIEDQAMEGYLRTVEFKRLKEKYSLLLSEGKNFKFSETVFCSPDVYGNFSIPDTDFFSEKLRNFKPSAEYLNDMNCSEEFKTIFSKGGTDINRMLHTLLLEGLEKNGIKKDMVSLVILTGGSSRWRFFMDMVSEVFPFTEIISSADPESTISRGLGLSYSSSIYEMRVRKELRDNKPQLIEELEKNFRSIVSEQSEKLADSMFGIYNPVVERNISAFFRNGGRISDLEKSIENDLSSVSQNVESLKKGFVMKIGQEMNDSVKKSLSRWFSRSGMSFEFAGNDGVEFADQHAQKDSHSIDTAIYGRITAVSSVIVGMISGSIMGGGGMALLASGPVGWVAGFAGGLLITVASMFGFREKLKGNFRNMHIPSLMLKVFLINEKRILKKSYSDLKKSIRDNMDETCFKMYDSFSEIEDKLNSIIDEQIDEISYSNFVDF